MGSPQRIEKHNNRGKLTARERIDLLKDDDSLFLEFSALAAHEVYDDYLPAAGIITGIVTVEGRQCILVANDATVKGGTYYPLTVKNIYEPRKLHLKTTCPAFTSLIAVAHFYQSRMKYFRIGIILDASFITKPR